MRLNFYANLQKKCLLLKDYKLEASNIISVSMSNTPPWIHYIDTIIDLSAHKKESTNINAYKHK